MIYFGYPLDIHGWKPKPETKPKPELENRGRKTNTKSETRKTETRGYPHRTRSCICLSGEITKDRRSSEMKNNWRPSCGDGVLQKKFTRAVPEPVSAEVVKTQAWCVWTRLRRLQESKTLSLVWLDTMAKSLVWCVSLSPLN